MRATFDFLAVAGCRALLLLIGTPRRRNADSLDTLRFDVDFAVTLAIWAVLRRCLGGVPVRGATSVDSRVRHRYYVGVDGISLLLVVLTGFLTPIALLSSWDSIDAR